MVERAVLDVVACVNNTPVGDCVFPVFLHHLQQVKFLQESEFLRIFSKKTTTQQFQIQKFGLLAKIDYVTGKVQNLTNDLFSLAVL